MYVLYITNKNYSSWSLQPWVLMQQLGIPFEERPPLRSTLEAQFMSNTNKTAAELLRLYYRALDTQDLDAIEGLFSPDADWRLPGRRYVGAAAIREGNAQSFALGLKTEHRFVHLLDGEGVALAEVRGQSRYGEKEVVMNGMVVVEAHDGKITRFCIYPDMGDYATYSAARTAAQG